MLASSMRVALISEGLLDSDRSDGKMGGTTLIGGMVGTTLTSFFELLQPLQPFLKSRFEIRNSRGQPPLRPEVFPDVGELWCKNFDNFPPVGQDVGELTGLALFRATRKDFSSVVSNGPNWAWSVRS